MKKKLIFFLVVLSFIFCLFAVTASAEVLDWTETQDLGFEPKTTTDGLVTFDTTSRVMLTHTVTDPETEETTTVYTTYPAYYILKCNDTVFSSKRTELDFSAINKATGLSYSHASVYKLEIPVGFVSMEDRNFRQGQGMDNVVYVKIPNTITTIGDFPFYAHAKIEEIDIADSVVNMNTYQAFHAAKKLVKVKFSRGITAIDSQMFYQCSALTTVTGFENITAIPTSTFYQCTKLTDVTLNENITSIGETAFFDCKALKQINLGNSLTSIGRSAFKNCTALESITIPAPLTDIGNTVFYGCTALEYVDYRASFVGTYMFDACSGLKTVTTTENLKTIKERGFRNCSALSSFEFCEGLEVIEDYAFYGTALLSVDLPSSLTTIGNSLFENVRTIKSVRIRGTVIGNKMFYNCSGITSVSLSMPTSVGANAFYATALKQDGKGAGVFFFTDTDTASLISIGTATEGNKYFSSAVLCTYEEYLDYIENGTVPEGKVFKGRNLLVYGCDYCETLYDGHDFTEEISATFAGDKFISECSLGQLCTRKACGKQVVKETLAPLFGFAGFSTKEYGSGAIIQGFTFNKNLFNKYTDIFGEISFGLLAGLDRLDKTNPDEASRFNGILYENGSFKDKVAAVDYTGRNFDILEIKLTGLASYPNASIYLCAYMLLNGEISYLNNKTINSVASSFSYSDIAK